jgi:Planctomycete cytochrome C
MALPSSLSRHPSALGLVAIALALCWAATAEAGPPPPIDFARDVRPLLAARSFGCHGPDQRRGGLRLDRQSDALRGGDAGAAIVPGSSVASLLIRKVSSRAADERMPPKDEPLTAKEVDRLRR